MPDVSSQSAEPDDRPSPGSLADMLQELRLLLQGSQLLTGFFTILPFSSGFQSISPMEKWIFLVTFLCSIVSLLCFSAPAVHHRLERPLIHRVRFKKLATKMMLTGMVSLSISIVLATQLVVVQILGQAASLVATVAVFLTVLLIWWVIPLRRRVFDSGPLA